MNYDRWLLEVLERTVQENKVRKLEGKFHAQANEQASARLQTTDEYAAFAYSKGEPVQDQWVQG